MNILVCLKIVDDLDGILEEDWKNASISSLNFDYTKKMVDYYDEAALELALRLKDSLRDIGSNCKVDVVTVDPVDRKLFFRSFFAVGVNNISQIIPEEELLFSPYKIASLISAFAKHDYDVLLFGMQNSLANDCQTYYAVAHTLNIDCITNITNLEMLNDDLKIYFDEDNYSFEGLVSPPIVIAVGDTQHPYLRMATLREKLKAGKKSANYYQSSEFLSTFENRLPEDFQLLSINREKHTRNCMFLPGSEGEFAEQLLQEYLAKWCN